MNMKQNWQNLMFGIDERRVITLHYPDHTCTVEPYAIGRDGGGTEWILCWRLSGGPEGDQMPGIQELDFKNVHRIELAGAFFSYETSPLRKDAECAIKGFVEAMSHIDARL